LSSGALIFKAGPTAFAELRNHGFGPERIGTIVGASGGAKWLVLSQLDRVIIRRIFPLLRGPVHLLGSSIGAWRFTCYARSSPGEALDRFEHAYLNQEYSERPDRDEISTVSRGILRELLGAAGAAEIVTHPLFRTHLMTVRSRHITASEQRTVLAAGMLMAASANVLSRRSLGAFFSRALFYDPRDLPPFFNATGFPLQRTMLTENNLEDVVLASGSIPLVLNGVRDIAGAPRGTYRDGGIIDYHLDLPTSEPDRLTLFPHFFPWITPGWFDKKLTWRRPQAANIDRTILVCPSPEFVARLPHGKIPDRTDFVDMTPERRRRAWQSTIAACAELADDLNDVLDKGSLPARLEPLC
jgi:hypothetical protein